MNYAGHVGMGVLAFGVASNILDITSTHSILEITGLLVITLFSASKIIDQDLKFAMFLPKNLRHKRYLYHRQITHSLMLWLILFIIGLFGFHSDLNSLISSVSYLNFNINYYILFFAIGGLSHLFADMLTGSVPIFLWGHYGKGMRIGINIDFTKKIFVKLGDKMYLPMCIIGITLIFFKTHHLDYLKHLIENIM